jgi:neutral ceramidase
MLWSNPTKAPTSLVDPTVGVIRIDRMDGSPLAILVNYACHPVIIGEDALQYSADFPGVMTKTVEQAFQGKAVALFLQGAGGDINPYYASLTLVNGALKARDWTGQQLAAEAIDVARGIETKADLEASLQFSEDILEVPVRWDAAKFRAGNLAACGPKVFEDHADIFAHHAQEKLNMPVISVLINKQLALVGLPGEPFVELQMDLRLHSPVRNSFLLGYTNGFFDYIPTIKAASEGEYGAGDSNTYVAVGTGERMINHALIQLYGMLGKWSDLPDDLGDKH